MRTIMDMTSEVGPWLSEELSVVSKVMTQHLQNEHAAVNGLCGELAAYSGKMLRPSLLLLSNRTVSGCVSSNNHVHTAAAVVELIHLATLVHDDVLDDADLRRGNRTMNSLRGNETAVMLGDYLLSSSFYLCSIMKNPELNILLGKITNTMCAGEVVQLLHRNNIDLDLDSYYQIIRDKTASLISGSCEMGAVLGGGNEKDVRVLRGFGNSIGIAFQIVDDLLDLLGERASIGKPTGRDLEKGKLTLPVILMLRDNPGLRPCVQELMDTNDRNQLRTMLESTGSISGAFQAVYELVDSAAASVQDIFQNEAADQLCALASHLKRPV